MKDKPSERHLIENELLLRAKNINGKEAIKKYFSLAKDLHNTPLEFHCECSDLKCEKMIKMSIEQYEKVHQRDDRFCVYKGHDIAAIEKIVQEEANYHVVQKDAVPAH